MINNQRNNELIAQDSGCLSVFFQTSFPGLLIFIIALPRLSDSIELFPFKVLKMDIWLVLIILLLCLLIPIIYAIVAFFRILAFPEVADTQSSPYAPASVVWFIPRFIGWIHVKSGEQVGLIGKTIYWNSSIFVMIPWRIVSSRTISVQQNTQSVTVTAAALDETQITIEIDYRYKIRSKATSRVIREYQDPYKTFFDDMASEIKNYVEETSFDEIVGPFPPLKKALEHQLKAHPFLKQFEIAIASKTVTGQRSTDRDTLARSKEQEAIAIINARVNEIEQLPELRAELVKDIVKQLGAGTIAGADVSQLDAMLQKLLMPGTSFFSSDKPQSESYKKLDRGDLSFADGGGIENYLLPGMDVIQQNPPNNYHIKMYGYIAMIEAENFPEQTTVKIWDLEKNELFNEIVKHRKTEHVLNMISNAIQDDIHGR